MRPLILAATLLASVLTSEAALAQRFSQVNLVSDVSGESQIVNGNGTTVRVFFCIDTVAGKIA